MSTQFIPGQNARARRNTTSTLGVEIVKDAHVTVESPRDALGLFTARLQGQTGLTFRCMDFEPVEAPEPFTPHDAVRDQDEAISLSYWLAEKMGEHVDDQGDETLTETVQRYVSREWMPKTGANPTPAPSLLDQDGDDDGREAAPLDPKSVHVGDTVTVRFKETGDVFITKAYQPDDITEAGEWVYLLGWPLNKPMGHGLAVTKFEILAVEPAPEPEWKPEAIVRATVNGIPDTLLMRLTPGYEGGFVWATPTLTPRRPQNEQSWLLYEDADITDVRPLVVLDPATVDVVELSKAAWDRWDGQPATESSNAHFRDIVRAVLVKLGLEDAR